MINLESILIPCEGFCVREIGDEIIILPKDGSKLHNINEAGRFIWNKIDGKVNLAAILKSLCEEYEVDESLAEKDLLLFADGLLLKGIVRIEQG